MITTIENPKGPFRLLIADQTTGWKERGYGESDVLGLLRASIGNIAADWAKSKPGRKVASMTEHGIDGVWLYYSDGKPRAYILVEPVPFLESHVGDILVQRKAKS